MLLKLKIGNGSFDPCGSKNKEWSSWWLKCRGLFPSEGTFKNYVDKRR